MDRMDKIDVCWDDVPAYISKEQFYRICHISKSTALYLLQSGKVPCEDSGKKTRRYKIKKEDVKIYLENREVDPDAYSPRLNVYDKNDKKDDIPEALRKEMNRFFYKSITAYPDVLCVGDVSEITGYAKSTVNEWCKKGYLKSFRKGNSNRIPKMHLLDFMCSPYFMKIGIKSPKHISMLIDFSKKE